MTVPYIFASATAPLPLSQLDSNFATAITLGSTSLTLGSTVTSVAGLTLTSATINGGTSTATQNLANVTGTLAVGNGGTGLSTLTAGYIPYGNGTSALGSSANFVFDGNNLGIGVTPSAWASTFKAIQVGEYGVGWNTHGSLPIGYLNANCYYNGSNWIYTTSNPVTQFVTSGQNGQFQWNQAASGTAGNAITFTQAMTLDNSGYLLVGTTSNVSSYKINVSHTSGELLGLNASSGTLTRIAFGNTSASFGSTQIIANGTALAFVTGSAEAMRIDSSGNLGLGVTPSAWDTNSRAIQLRNSGGLYDLSFGGVSTYTFLSNNSYRSASGIDRYLNSYPASSYYQNNGIHYWNTAPSGTAGNAITFTEAMRIDSSGKVGIGTTTPAEQLAVAGSITATGNFIPTNGATNIGYLGNANSIIGGSSSNIGLRAESAMLFSTGGSTERMRIHNSGGVSIGNTTDPGATNLSVTGTGTFGSNLFLGTAAATDTSTRYINSAGSAYYGINAIGAYLYTGTALPILFLTNNTEAMRIDSSGNVGIGTTSPNSNGVGGVPKLLQIYNSGTSVAQLVLSNADTASGAYPGVISFVSSALSGADKRIAEIAATKTDASTSSPTGALTFNTSAGSDPVERARIDSSGNLLVGCTSLPSASVKGSALLGDANQGRLYVAANSTGARDLAYWINPNGVVGTITTSGTTTTYNVTSDYRLKTVIGPVADAGQRIDALQPVEYTWNVDGSHTRGFLAHQFQEVYAGSVTGAKDAVDVEGKPVYQAMQASTSEVIADLVAEIQSLRKRILTLENK